MVRIKLQSSEGEVLDVDFDVAKQSITIKTMIEGAQVEDAPVPLPNVRSDILKKVLQWCAYHKDDPVDRKTEDVCSWDVGFLSVSQETLFELIIAADYLNVKGLLDVACKTVASMIKGKSPDDIRRTFNISSDFKFMPAGMEPVEVILCDAKVLHSTHNNQGKESMKDFVQGSYRTRLSEAAMQPEYCAFDVWTFPSSVQYVYCIHDVYSTVPVVRVNIPYRPLVYLISIFSFLLPSYTRKSQLFSNELICYEELLTA